MAVRDGASLLRVSRSAGGPYDFLSATMDCEINGLVNDLVAPWGAEVDQLYAMLVAEPEPWYRRLIARFRRERGPVVQEAAQGQIEARVRDVTIPIGYDVLPHPDGMFIALEFAVTAEQRARIGFQ
jgi:hypothetical protein